MTEKYIINLEEKMENKNYYEAVVNTKKVREYLEKQFNKPFHFIDISNIELNMFYEDYEKKSTEVEFLTKISEDFIDKQAVYVENELERISEPTRNSVFYYPKYEVAIATIYNFTTTGTRSLHYAFFTDEKKYLNFHKEAERRSRMVDDKEIIVFIDTPDGIHHERQTVNELIDRSQVVLEKKVKDDIYNSIDQFFTENEEFYKKYRIPHKRGILLYGEPGNGKTTLVKSLVGTIDSPVIYWQINEFTNSGSIKMVFDTVANMSPVVLVIEDLDSLPEFTRSTFLNTLDGATTKDGFYLIGTTNYPEKVDKALINRVGRFDRTYEIKLPSEDLRYEYLKMRGMGDFMSDVETKNIASKTSGFSFVQLSEIFRQVAYAGFHGEEYDTEDIILALKENNRKTETRNWNTKKEDKVMGFRD